MSNAFQGELEVSPDLPQLSRREAEIRTAQNISEGGKAAIGLYLFVRQGGLRASGTHFEDYCRDVFGIAERTGRYWLARVRATLVARGIGEQNLLAYYMTASTNLRLLPTALAVEVCRLPPGQALPAYERWATIRGDEKGGRKSAAKDFRKIAAQMFGDQNAATVAAQAHSGTIKQPEANMIQPPPTPREAPEETVGQDSGEDESRMFAAPTTEPPPCPDCGEPLSDGCQSVTELTVTSATPHAAGNFWLVRATDGNGRAYVMRLNRSILQMEERQ